MIDKEINDKINQLLNNGFAFPEHLTSEERDEVEQSLLSWYDKYGISSFIEEEMIYTTDGTCLLYTSPSPRDVEESRMPSSA